MRILGILGARMGLRRRIDMMRMLWRGKRLRIDLG